MIRLAIGLGAFALAISTLLGQRIPTTVPGATGLCSLAVADGVVYVGSYDSGGVTLSRSKDGGDTWTAPIRVNQSGGCHFDEVKVAASGANVFVVWDSDDACSGSYPRLRFNRSLDGGQTWLAADVTLDAVSPTSLGFTPTVTVEGGAVYVTWEGRVTGADPIRIYFNRSLDFGTTWLPQAVALADAGVPNDGRGSCVAVSGSVVHVVWREARVGYWDVQYQRSLDQGVTWLPNDVRLNLGVPAGSQRSNWVGIAAQGSSVCVVWADRRAWANPTGTSDCDIFCNRSTDDGTTWLATDVRVGPGNVPAAYEVVAPKLAMVGNTVHLVWSDRRSGSYEPFAKRSLDGGATWLPPETRLNGSVAAGAGYALGAEVVASPDLTAAVWIESRPISSPREIYLNRSLDDGATWSPTELRLSQTGSPSLKLFAKVGIEMDTTHTIWAEDTVMTLRHAIASGYLAYGSGTPGAGNIVPRVRGSGVPGIGATFTIAVEEGAGGVFGLLAAGFGAGSRTAVPMFGGTMLVQPTAIFGLLLGGAGPGTGSASLPVAVPSDVALLGLSINWQALLLDPAGPMGVTLTNGLELWIG